MGIFVAKIISAGINAAIDTMGNSYYNMVPMIEKFCHFSHISSNCSDLNWHEHREIPGTGSVTGFFIFYHRLFSILKKSGKFK